MDYWKDREGLNYYNVVRERMELVSSGGSLMDVGGHNTPVVSWGNFRKRTCINLEEIDNKIQGVEYRIMDFMDYDPDARFDVVTCLQVLEHIDNETIEMFAKKILAHATSAVIISVPYKWEKGSCEYHLQDPVDLEKLISWFGVEPENHTIITDRTVRRLIATFKK